MYSDILLASRPSGRLYKLPEEMYIILDQYQGSQNALWSRAENVVTLS